MRTVAAAVFILVIALNLAVLIAHSYRQHQWTAPAAPTADQSRITALESQVRDQQHWIDDHTQSPRWNAPVSVSEDRAMGSDGRTLVRDALSGAGMAR